MATAVADLDPAEQAGILAGNARRVYALPDAPSDPDPTPRGGLMLTGRLLHPGILAALAGAGHGSLVLITDANYPATTTRGPNAAVVHLNLTPGVVDAVTVVAALAAQVPVEEAFVMAPATSGSNALDADPPIWSRFAAALTDAGAPVPLQRLERTAFYAAAGTPDVALTVVTGETEIYANLLFRVGVVR